MITVARVDERLIHGQVVAAWTTNFQIKKIVIIDDAVANNAMLIRINQGMLPRTVSLDVVTEKDAYDFISSNVVTSDENTLILAKTPRPYADLAEKGVQLERVVIGNMIKSANRKKIAANCYASTEETAQMKSMVSKGIEVVYQLTPDVAAKNLGSLL